MSGSALNPRTNQNVVRFGLFELDLRTGELRKSGIRIKLQEQPFRILALLLESPGEVVTRQAIRENLWSQETFAEYEQGINAAVAKLRVVLGDSAENPRFVEIVGSTAFAESSSSVYISNKESRFANLAFAEDSHVINGAVITVRENPGASGGFGVCLHACEADPFSAEPELDEVERPPTPMVTPLSATPIALG